MREAKTKTCKRAVVQGTSALSNRRFRHEEHLAGGGEPLLSCSCCDAGMPSGLGCACEPGGSLPKPKIRPSIACVRAGGRLPRRSSSEFVSLRDV